MAAYGIAHTSFGPMLVASEGKRLLAVKFSVDAGQLPEAVDALHRELGGRYGLQRDDDAVAPFVRQLTDYLYELTPFDPDLAGEVRRAADTHRPRSFALR